ncbi:MAG: BLUF domain-containing protein [Chromatiales bacterium]|nr:BLUF domain-containing protein [Chromatiales bacterium]
MLVRLVYFSRALREMSLKDIQDILRVARGKNAALEVCGMLCYHSQWFLQALEGDREEVNALYLEIADDPRHDDVVIVSYEPIDSPAFGDWQMGYATQSGALVRALQGLGQREFDPPTMSPSEALEFLRAMAAEERASAA